MIKKNKLIACVIFLLFYNNIGFSQTNNYAIQFDGIDDEIDIFMDVIPTWTVEAWVKGNDTLWNADEVIVGNGWFYPTGNLWEDYPLLLKNGKLTAFRSEVIAPNAIDDKWHHLASSCDGTTTKIYIDGQEVASSKIAKPIGPNFIGSDDGKEFFTGIIDEVRIWKGALTASEINDWKSKSISSSHPSFSNLLAYYTFDDQALDATDLTLDNIGDIKNDDYYNPKANDPIYVLNDNTSFILSREKMELLCSDVIQNDWLIEDSEKEAQILKLKISVQGNKDSLRLNELNIDLSETTSLSDISNVHIYYLGNTPESKKRKKIFKTGKPVESKMTFTTSVDSALALIAGINYFEITFDLNNNMDIGNQLDAAIPSFKLNDVSYFPKNINPKGAREIILGKSNPNIVKTLAYNIWHGGRETGYDLGVQRTIEVIKATKADIIFMVESYGAQQEISDSLGFYLYTLKPKANLSIHSRFPIIETYTPGYSGFQAIGAKIRLENGREIIVYDVWLRYSQPDYSTEYRSSKPDPDLWIKGDTETTVVDLNGIFEKDISVNATNPNIPILIGGDFNSASHLDWTADTTPLHGGIGKVDWPVHKIMINEKGYTDSYRFVHPNPFTHQGSTWAAIFKWSNNLRIDYIYHKGLDVKPIASKVIETHPDVGVMWPSDHSAVLTTYDFKIP